MKIKTAILLLLILILVRCPVLAEESLMMLKHSGSHNYFDLTANRGERGYLEFDLINRTENKIRNHLLIYDSITAVNGGNEIMSPEEFSSSGTAGWFGGNLWEIELDPGEESHMRVNFNIPIDIAPGVYTAIFALYSSADSIKAASNENDEIVLNINNYYTSTVAIVIRVGKNPNEKVEFGERAEIKIDSDSGRVYLYIPICNAGDTYEFPVVNVKISDGNDNVLFEGENKMDIVYRKTDCLACFDISGKITEAGEYKANAEITGNEPGRFEKKERIFYIKLGDEKVKEVIVKQADRNSDDVSEWSGAYFILGKKQMLIGIGIVLAIGFLVLMVVFISVKRKKRPVA